MREEWTIATALFLPRVSFPMKVDCKLVPSLVRLNDDYSPDANRVKLHSSYHHFQYSDVKSKEDFQDQPDIWDLILSTSWFET